jgi:hypothetical protein
MRLPNLMSWKPAHLYAHLYAHLCAHLYAHLCPLSHPTNALASRAAELIPNLQQ